MFNVPRVIARVNSPKNQRIFRECGIECVSSTTLIATIIEEDAVLGGISVLSSLSHGNVALNQVSVPRFRHHNPEEGVLAYNVPLPERRCLIVAVSRDDNNDMEVVGSDTLPASGRRGGHRKRQASSSRRPCRFLRSL